MQPIRPRTMNIPGTPAITVSPRIMLSNFITMLVTANHRPTMLRPFSPSLMSTWFETATGKAMRNDDSEKLALMFSEARAADFKEPMRLFMADYAGVIGGLMLDPEYVPDAGEEMAQRLIESGDWEKIHVTNPSLGYPRPYFMFKYEIGDGVPLFGTTLKELQDLDWASGANGQKLATRDPRSSLSKQVQSALARLCWNFDRIYMGVNLIPEAKNVGERDSKEPFIGKTAAAQLQARRLTAIPLLYMAQYAALWPRIVSRIDDYATELARLLYPRDEAALTLRTKVRSAALAKIPLHPLLATFASMFESKVNLSTYFGEKDCLLVPNTVSLPSTDVSGSSRSGLAQIAMAAALGDQLRLAALSSTGSGSGWVASVLGDVAPNVPATLVNEQGAITRGVGFASLLEMLVRISRFVDLFPTVEQQLGWTGAKSISLTGMEAAGADFVLSNGDYYSDSPAMVLAGLRSSLPIANNKVMGFSRRFDDKFNTGPVYGLSTPLPTATDADLGLSGIVWSTLTCKGHRANADTDDVYSKFYMPAGMSMGEEGGEARWNDERTADPIGKRVASYYQQMSPSGYVRIDATVPKGVGSRSAVNLFRHATDWDTAVETSSDPAAAQKELLDVYGVQGTDKTVSLLRYRDAWTMRIPARLARENKFMWLNEVGNLIRVESFDGNVVFDDHIALPNDVTVIDSLLSLLPVDEPRFSTEITNEVISPE